MNEQAVIVHFEYAADGVEDLFEIEERLEDAIEAAGVGEFDGNEIALDLSDGSLYMYGPDAEALFAVARPILEGAACFGEMRVVLQFGPPETDTPERVETLRGRGEAPSIRG